MVATTTSNTLWIYQGGPSKTQVETESQYKKTRENYEYYMREGIMLQLQAVQAFPAPVLCPNCEKPVITAMENERTMNDKINIVLGSIMSCGLCLPMAKNYHRSMMHRCPSCRSPLVRLDRDLSQTYRATVLAHYRSANGGPANSQISTINVHGGGIHYQWNNHNSNIGTQAGDIGTQNQNNGFRANNA